MSIIEVRDLYKIYKAGSTSVNALDGVTFNIEKGEFIAIIGPSGSGKSTLLNMLAGLESPSKGEVLIDGVHIEKLSENQLVAFRRKHVGFVFQSYNLIPTMTAVENVALPLMFRGVGKKEREEIAVKYLTLLGLGDSLRNYGNAMSGGQQQRVGIARALATDPPIIFADEPTGNLDTKSGAEVLQLLKNIIREGEKTLIMVTHSPAIANAADRKICIVDGRITDTLTGIV